MKFIRCSKRQISVNLMGYFSYSQDYTMLLARVLRDPEGNFLTNVNFSKGYKSVRVSRESLPLILNDYKRLEA